ncbi:MAG: division/cell wall cluster transcriptional repressor MraZ [Pseudomonadales bacterium]|jgi:MraZ protein|nr:division/cell wall cluster transcriptional repressor MraZ [Pseudomonadales bacterium]MDP6470873.1 division/cell wall cluster transcriptional repressor MraZ [Pseudomonadales bacterium]MDP6825942.1 division/cell wall cluster transcriptional repressor MraZ [Pseudomonadales bacterium]MDP6972254.1 division/cell wall cluster transcriptional repressor MraZ [Pseudomonadales bacterium]|tara:strand:+ start:3410 stop:3868 length:459 start_codon:yes stop_codon:yes gene_type:complete
MFRGISSAKLDAKGRMALPVRLRGPVDVRCEGKLVLTIDMRERCLLLYPLPEWEIVQRKLEGLPNINPDARLLQRLLIGHATDIELDANSRLLIPPKLREFAGLQKTLILAGQGNKLEIWAEESWNGGVDDWLDQARSRLATDGDAFTGLSV